MNLPLPILAVDAGAIVGLLVLIFTIVGWLVNAANTQNNPPPPVRAPRQPRRRPEDERIQDEIEVFLNEVRGKRAKPAAPVEEVQLEVIEEAAPRESLEHRLAERRRAREAREAREAGEHRIGRAPEMPTSPTPGAAPAVAIVAPVVPVAAPVVQPTALTGSTAAFSSVEAAALPRTAVAAMLRSRRGIQDAIIINELLAKPKALRNRLVD